MSLQNLIETLLKRIRLFVVAVLVGLVGLHFWVRGQPKAYGYAALLKQATEFNIDANNRGSLTIPRMNEADTASNVIANLLFKYGRESIFSGTRDSFLESANVFPRSGLIELKAVGPSLESGKRLLTDILRELQQQAAPKLEEQIGATKEKMRVMESQILEKKMQIRDIDKSLSSLGHSTPLIEEREKLSSMIVDLTGSFQILKSSISANNVNNFYYEELRPVSQGPIYPNFRKLYFTGVMFIFGGALYLILMIEFFSTAAKRPKPEGAAAPPMLPEASKPAELLPPPKSPSNLRFLRRPGEPPPFRKTNGGPPKKTGSDK